ncbi:MAG: hypothetical protein QOG63_2593 [Thermoleophilaceae bacterium]|jgi:hypothetical protein|nr:hypothetical protein [Thermoleophilaceae bacterium]
MPTYAIRIDMPPKGIEATGEGSSPTDAEMAGEQEARQEFMDLVSPELASLMDKPPRRSGNVSHVQLLGADTWSNLNHYLLLVQTDIGPPSLALESVLPAGAEVSEIGAYAPLQEWPEATA